jgi:SDR family mycofactocin-dependent oxidoreductase
VSKRLEGKVAFVTGAARGMGRAIAVRLAEEGADIIACDLPGAGDGYRTYGSEDAAVTAKLVEETGRGIVFGDADVRKLDQLEAAVAAGVDRFGRLDVVVANAGTIRHAGAIEMSEEDWQFVLDVNLTGAWLTCKAAVPHVQAGGQGGSVVLNCSVRGLAAGKGAVSYMASKHGVTGLMRALAIELAPDNIRVNSVHPGFVDTPLLRNQLPEGAPLDVTALNLLPTPAIEPEDVAASVAYLASDDARYVTGVTLPVDAGFLLK